MDIRIRILTIGGAVAILVMVIELVRRRKLKEEYSVLWVITAVPTRSSEAYLMPRPRIVAAPGVPSSGSALR